MKQLLLLLLFLFNADICFSQGEKLIQGKILLGETALPAIDVVNINSRQSATTDKEGHFNMLAKVNDVLYIISKEYTDRRITLSQDQLDQNILLIYLETKPIELDDVEIFKAPNLKVKVDQVHLDQIKLEKQAQTLKVQNVYDGTIENGIDFKRIVTGLINLFKNKGKEKTEKPLPPITLKEYLAANFDTNFYIQKLKLKPEEIALFISFCETDLKAKAVTQHQDILEAMDFLVSKNEEFKKLTK